MQVSTVQQSFKKQRCLEVRCKMKQMCKVTGKSKGI